MQEPTEQGGERQPPSQTMAKVRRAASSWSWCALGWAGPDSPVAGKGSFSPVAGGKQVQPHGPVLFSHPYPPSPVSLHCPGPPEATDPARQTGSDSAI